MNFDNFFGRRRHITSTIGPPPDLIASHPKSTPQFAYKPGELIADRYEVVTILSGGMGVVYLCADHERQQRPLALKTFKPKYLSSRKVRDRFLREGTIWVRFAHPNIVRAHGVERVGDGREIYLVLEWVAAAEGKEDASLRAWMEGHKSLPIRQALLIALHIARGMRYATQEIPGLVHRDLKPENVLIGRDGITRVTDFGLASMLVNLEDRAGKTDSLRRNWRRTIVSHGLVGTPLYMAPEQWRKDQLIDARTDIYAFGCILYEMLAGRPVVIGSNLQELAKAHRSGRHRAIPPQLPLEIKALIKRCLAIDPAARCQDWNEVVAALQIIYKRLLKKDPPPEISVTTRDSQAIHTELVATAWSYNAMGLSYYDIGHYDLAGGYFERVIWVGEQEKEMGLEAVGLNHLGNVCRALSDTDGALRNHMRQLKLARTIKNRAEETEALGNLGKDYAQIGDIDRAVGYFKQQITLAKELKDLRREGSALQNWGDASLESDRPNEAITFYKQALKVARENEDQAKEGRIIASIGLAYAHLGEVKRAVKYYKRAMKMAKHIGDRTGQGQALGYLGIAYRKLGNTEQAVTHLMEYLQIAQESGLKFEEGRVLSKLGTIYFEENDPEQARDFFSQCLKIVRELGDQHWLWNVLEQVGDCYRELGSLDQAIGFYEERLQVAKSLGEPGLIARGLHTLGNGYSNFRDAPRAHPYYEEALAIAEGLGDKLLIADIHLDFAVLLSWRGDRDEANWHCETALQILKGLKNKERLKEARRVQNYIRKKRN